MLLSRVADSLFWGARYLERAEDTARLVRSYTDMLIDLPTSVGSSWEPLLALAGTRAEFDATHARNAEADIVRFLVSDPGHGGSVVGAVARARENLRTTREVLPREAWQTVNDLFLYTGSDAEAGVQRRSRARFLNRVVADCQRFDGVLTAGMSRDEAYEIWRLGQNLERADMTTRVLGVRAAALLAQPIDVDDHDEVQWMGVLRSLNALQMYQRSTRGPIEGAGAVRFLLFDAAFPRSVTACTDRIRRALANLPHAARTVPVVDELDTLLRSVGADAANGAALDDAMDAVQRQLAALNECVAEVFVRSTERTARR